MKDRGFMRRLSLFVLVLLLSGLARAGMFDDLANSAVDYSKARIEPRSNCLSLLAATGSGFSVISAELVGSTCRVSGIIPGEIRFEVNLPNPWNGRLMMTGNGGLAGQPPESAGAQAARDRSLKYNFATVYTDTGHDNRVEPGATFAHNNLAKLVDYGYRGIHLTVLTAKLLVRDYYRKPQRHTYFAGCSNGGRQALMAAQRFPEDFDGILAGAPANDFTGLKFSQAHRMKAMQSSPLSLDEVRMLGRRIYQQCDELDGLVDGLIDDPRACMFDPDTLPGCDGPDQVDCFDQEEVAALKAYYSPVLLAGEKVYPPFPVGSEGEGPYYNNSTMPGWMPWVINVNGRPYLDSLGSEFFRYIVFVKDRPDYNWIDFDYREIPDNLRQARDTLDAVNPDLSRFERRGGKLLSYFGWADPDINPLSTIDYYDSVKAISGEETEDFYRLFMVPGMFHCSGGPGPSHFDGMTPLINWVEKGIKPERIEAAHMRSGGITYTRPLCPYPEVAKYGGNGDTKDSASFACKTP